MKFSITIPAFKASYLKECIESILCQTYKDFELIIVNDASPEDLTSIVNSFSDPRIHYYINETNCGALNVIDNWNKCLEYATGDYVICMGDDDKLLPNCLEEYVKLIKKYPGLGVYHAWTEIIDENSMITGMQELRPEYESVYSMMWGRWHGRMQYIGDFLFDTALLKGNGGFFKLPFAWGSDDISAYIAASKNGIANMQVPGFQYRNNAQNISKTSNAMIKVEAICLEEAWYKEFLSEKSSCLNTTDNIFKNMLLERLDKVMMKKRVYTVANDLADNSIMKIFQYVAHKSQLQLNYKLIAYALINALKCKVIRKEKEKKKQIFNRYA